MLKCFCREFARKTNAFDVVLGTHRLSVGRQVIVFQNRQLSFNKKTRNSDNNGSEKRHLSSPSIALVAGVASFLRNDSDHEQTGEEKIIYMIKLAKLSHQVVHRFLLTKLYLEINSNVLYYSEKRL